MKTPTLFFILLIAEFACRERTIPEKENVIGPLVLKYPATDSFVTLTGIDTYAAYLITDKDDTFHIEFGKSG